VTFPGLSSPSTGVVVSVALVETSTLLAGGSQTTAFAVLMNGLDNPVDARITADGLMLWVDKDNFVVFVCGILVNPVGVENTQIGASSANTLLSGRSERSLIFQLIDTLVGWLAIGSTFWNRLLATSTSDTDTVDDISLLGLVSKTTSLVRTRWTRRTMADR